jgi:hypothetical protein
VTKGSDHWPAPQMRRGQGRFESRRHAPDPGFQANNLRRHGGHAWPTTRRGGRRPPSSSPRATGNASQRLGGREIAVHTNSAREPAPSMAGTSRLRARAMRFIALPSKSCEGQGVRRRSAPGRADRRDFEILNKGERVPVRAPQLRHHLNRRNGSADISCRPGSQNRGVRVIVVSSQSLLRKTRLQKAK